METTPESVDEQERRIREEQQGGSDVAPEETTPGDGSDGDDKGHDEGAGSSDEGDDTAP